MPATFITKEEITGAVAGAREIGGIAQQFQAGGMGDADFLSKLERLLTQVNGIMSQANSLRGNPITRQIAPALASPSPDLGQPFAGAPSGAPQFNAPAPQPATNQPVISLNEQNAKLFFEEIINELGQLDEAAQKKTIADTISLFKTPIIGDQLKGKGVNKLKEWLPRLVRM